MLADRLYWLTDMEEPPLKPLSQAEARDKRRELEALAEEEPRLKAALTERPALSDFLVAVLTLAPHLRDIALADPPLLADAVSLPLEPQLLALIEDARLSHRPRTETGASADGPLPSESEVMSRLRIAKRKLSFLLALADLGRIFDARQTTAWLSKLAEAATASAIDHLLLSAHESRKLKLIDPARPSEGSGLIVLGMGKLGAGELNYSSDIDLVVFYDQEAGPLADPEDAADLFPRLMRRLVRILQDRTGDGYVFRTDLRLRPDPGATPLAISVEAALIYYEGRGQNWERAAFIKARPVAGDIVAGERFLKDLAPFVFRKYLDYAAIADIHSIKRQIHAHKGHGEIAVKGHNVKLGRGGIREIEFFVQTQQLIAGGRMPALRARATEDALAALAEARWIDEATRAALSDCYWFLRDVEHRVQMVRDEQTHLLPDTDAELRRIAYMTGAPDMHAFCERMTAALKTVEQCYQRLFEQERRLSGEDGNLVFTGQNDDPDTLKTLERLGFERPGDVSRILRTWHNGRYRATQSSEARERLTELMPEFLRVFGASRRADEAIFRFDSFIAGLPAGIQLFSLIGSNPALLSLLCDIMSAAPKLAEVIAARPHVFDGMLDPALLVELPTAADLAPRLAASLSEARGYEDVLDRLRIFAAEQRFLIGIRLLTGAIAGQAAGRAFTDLADLVLEAALRAVLGEMEAAHGRISGGRVALIGMGKLGSRELTAGSDVDLILLYDHAPDAAESDGAKPLDPMRYYARATQRLIAALSAPTAEGVLYEVDMRLRPSGNKGPVATRISAFRKYQQEEAETWEHMALTRARAICGDAALLDEARAIRRDILSLPRDPARIARDVAAMRALIEQEKPPKGPFDLKLAPGGIVDLEFIAQYLVLSCEGPPPEEGLSSGAVLAGYAPQALSPEERAMLTGAFGLYTDLSQLIRLSIDGLFEPDQAPAGLADRLCRMSDCPDLSSLSAEIKRRGREVRRIFRARVG